MSSAICAGMGEKCEYEFPARRSDLQTDGAMKTSDGGVSSSISCDSIWTSASVSVMADSDGGGVEEEEVVVVLKFDR
jgi:hypothetical protein